MNDYVKVYPIQVRKKCIWYARMKGEYVSNDDMWNTWQWMKWMYINERCDTYACYMKL